MTGDREQTFIGMIVICTDCVSTSMLLDTDVEGGPACYTCPTCKHQIEIRFSCGN